MSKGKYLAVDLGDRRTGLAISDVDKQVAFPREVVEHKTSEELIARIQALCAEEPVTKIILGLPFQMDGTPGERFLKTRQFGDRLQTAVRPIPVEYFDERLTTKQSLQKLRQQGKSAKEMKTQADMVSAQVILEEYLRAINYE